MVRVKISVSVSVRIRVRVGMSVPEVWLRIGCRTTTDGRTGCLYYIHSLFTIPHRRNRSR